MPTIKQTHSLRSCFKKLIILNKTYKTLRSKNLSSLTRKFQVMNGTDNRTKVFSEPNFCGQWVHFIQALFTNVEGTTLPVQQSIPHEYFKMCINSNNFENFSFYTSINRFQNYTDIWIIVGLIYLSYKLNDLLWINRNSKHPLFSDSYKTSRQSKCKSKIIKVKKRGYVNLKESSTSLSKAVRPYYT